MFLHTDIKLLKGNLGTIVKNQLKIYLSLFLDPLFYFNDLYLCPYINATLS